MAKRTYTGVEGVARRVRRGYAGCARTARKVKRAYIGAGGAARPCWGGGVPFYWGTVPAASESRVGVGAAAVGSYAVFAGGSGYSTAVDAFTRQLTRLTPEGLTVARFLLAGASTGNHALFGGGSDASNRYAVVDAYDHTLTRTAAPALGAARSVLQGQSHGGMALFMGGENYPTYYATMEFYDPQLTRTTGTAGRVAHSYAATAKTQSYALFAGGYTSGGGRTAVTDAYDADMTRAAAGDLCAAKVSAHGTTVGQWAVLAGGYISAKQTSADAYSDTLTRTGAPGLAVPRHGGGAAALEDYGLICGGGAVSAELYDRDLVHSMADPSANEGYAGVTLCGDTAVFWAGNCAEIYQI